MYSLMWLEGVEILGEAEAMSSAARVLVVDQLTLKGSLTTMGTDDVGNNDDDDYDDAKCIQQSDKTNGKL